MQTLTREEFDQRLEAATEQLRRERLHLEAQNAQLRELVEQYAVTLEQLEAVTSAPESRRNNDEVKETLRRLADRSSALADVL